MAGVAVPPAAAPGLTSESLGAALSRPVTPSTLPAREAGREIAPLYARSW
ncbi:MAG TPA: hypothetical protein VMV92_14725 [Streptosporangiaceae bacterium]|nr:hypothetical protein [Streptosporangiaceae bacterium]